MEGVLEPVAAVGGAVGRESVHDRVLDVVLAVGADEDGDPGGCDERAAHGLVVPELVGPGALERAPGVEAGAALFEQHLNFCEGCVWYVEQIKTTIETLGDVREDDIPSEAKDRLMSAFRDWRGS